ncbi:MAG: hypothetical protein NTZ05_22040, partial [Chloroflexi bacterium]|nr:hypothetical protein [Chloroflexota bacterium]
WAIAGQPILTKNVSGTGTACATTPNDGGCLLGGLTTGLSNMATSIALTGGTADIPTGTSISGTANAATDNLLLYVFFPTNGTQATFGGLTSTLTFAFSAVQPAGTLNPSR